MTGHAEHDGTRRYAARFAASAAPGNYRPARGCASPGERAPLLSSVGIGTYLGSADPTTDQAYTAALIEAVQGGINVIDSAINYRLQRSERSIGTALQELGRRGFAREELFICTKGGYLTPDRSIPDNPAAYFQSEYFAPGILRAEDVAAGCHAMSPGFLANQLDRSLTNLGLDCIDVYYLHNPETQLGDVSREEFLRRLRAAFEFLESAAADHKIRFYGVATWNGFRQAGDARDFLAVAEIEQVARELAGSAHHFRFVQLPFNLAMTEALTRANQPAPNQPANAPAVSMVEAAEALELSLIASATLLQGKLAHGLPNFIAEALKLETDAERAIQFARSTPGIVTALTGMSRVEHVRANLKLMSQPLVTSEQFMRLFERGQKS